jgi:hypothetical protein
LAKANGTLGADNERLRSSGSSHFIRAALLRAQEVLYFFESNLSVLISINGFENPCMDRLHFL